VLGEFKTWSDWAYAMELANLLTLAEVIERLSLEYWLQGVYGIRGIPT